MEYYNKFPPISHNNENDQNNRDVNIVIILFINMLSTTGIMPLNSTWQNIRTLGTPKNFHQVNIYLQNFTF